MAGSRLPNLILSQILAFFNLSELRIWSRMSKSTRNYLLLHHTISSPLIIRSDVWWSSFFQYHQWAQQIVYRSMRQKDMILCIDGGYAHTPFIQDLIKKALRGDYALMKRLELINCDNYKLPGNWAFVNVNICEADKPLWQCHRGVLKSKFNTRCLRWINQRYDFYPIRSTWYSDLDEEPLWFKKARHLEHANYKCGFSHEPTPNEDDGLDDFYETSYLKFAEIYHSNIHFGDDFSAEWTKPLFPQNYWLLPMTVERWESKLKELKHPNLITDSEFEEALSKLHEHSGGWTPSPDPECESDCSECMDRDDGNFDDELDADGNHLYWNRKMIKALRPTLLLLWRINGPPPYTLIEGPWNGWHWAKEEESPKATIEWIPPICRSMPIEIRSVLMHIEQNGMLKNPIFFDDTIMDVVKSGSGEILWREVLAHLAIYFKQLRQWKITFVETASLIRPILEDLKNLNSKCILVRYHPFNTKEIADAYESGMHLGSPHIIFQSYSYFCWPWNEALLDMAEGLYSVDLLETLRKESGNFDGVSIDSLTSSQSNEFKKWFQLLHRKLPSQLLKYEASKTHPFGYESDNGWEKWICGKINRGMVNDIKFKCCSGLPPYDYSQILKC